MLSGIDYDYSLRSTEQFKKHSEDSNQQPATENILNPKGIIDSNTQPHQRRANIHGLAPTSLLFLFSLASLKNKFCKASETKGFRKKRGREKVPSVAKKKNIKNLFKGVKAETEKNKENLSDLRWY